MSATTQPTPTTDALMYRRYSSAGLACAAVDKLAGAARMVFRPEGDKRQPFVVEPVRKQIRDMAGLLMLMVVTFPPTFMAADWLRYSA